jgi:hypothetical protein
VSCGCQKPTARAEAQITVEEYFYFRKYYELQNN